MKAYKKIVQARGWNVEAHPNSGFVLKHKNGNYVQQIFPTPHLAWQIAGEQIELGLEPS